MAIANASLIALRPISSPSLSPSTPQSTSPTVHVSPISATKKRVLSTCTFALEKSNLCEKSVDVIDEEKQNGAVLEQSSETLLYSFSPLPLLLFAALPGDMEMKLADVESMDEFRAEIQKELELLSQLCSSTVTSLASPFVELVKSWSLPSWLVHWGHPGNMAVVLFAMGGYGTYLGFRIRFSNDIEEKAKAKDLHPKLLGGMFFFFALGATGGITALLTSDKPIFESPHAVTGFIGLALLTFQTLLPSLFEGNPGLRNIHGILGSGIMTLFVVHAALGLQLGLSY